MTRIVLENTFDNGPDQVLPTIPITSFTAIAPLQYPVLYPAAMSP